AGLALDDAYPMAALQLGMVFHSEYDPETAVYHDVFSYRLAMPFDERALRGELEALFARHPALRTSFVMDGVRAPLQAVHRRGAPPAAAPCASPSTTGGTGPPPRSPAFPPNGSSASATAPSTGRGPRSSASMPTAWTLASSSSR